MKTPIPCVSSLVTMKFLKSWKGSRAGDAYQMLLVLLENSAGDFKDW